MSACFEFSGKGREFRREEVLVREMEGCVAGAGIAMSTSGSCARDLMIGTGFVSLRFLQKIPRKYGSIGLRLR